MSEKAGKVLFAATVMEHFRAFHLPYIMWFMSRGYEVHALAGTDCDMPQGVIKHIMPIKRSPFALDNIKAYRQMKKLMDGGDFSLIHCHTPVGGALTRLAARKARRSGTKLIYTAHGFHFYSGAPLFSWLIYYPMEKWLGRYTDILVTINEEDYTRAKQKRLCKDLRRVHGVGADSLHYHPCFDEQKRRELRRGLGLSDRDFACVCVGELNDNKNQIAILKAMPSVIKSCDNFKLLLCGAGKNEELYKETIAALGLSKNAVMLGYRRDLPEIVPACDMLVSASLREGMPVNVIEAMLCGLPVAVSCNRGHRELVTDGVEGYVFRPNDQAAIETALQKLCKEPAKAAEMGENGLKKAALYADKSAVPEMISIYEDLL